jgi:aminopeptidase N
MGKGVRAMQEFTAHRKQPELKQLVTDASRALARLDAGRLEELALSCQALNRELAVASDENRVELARQAHQAAGEMAAFAKVLDMTRGNLNVMFRLQQLRSGRLEYGERPAGEWTPPGSGHGNN